MAVLEVSFRSQVLGKDTHMTVIMPSVSKLFGEPLRALYLLHGYGDDDTAWLRKTGIEQYADRHGIAVICPDASQSCYCDMAHGPAYTQFISDEIPRVCESMFNISRKPQDKYIAGLSMGGYGALKIGLLDPEQFAAIGCFSGALNPPEIFINLGRENIGQGIFGEDLTLGGENDLYLLSVAAAKLKHTAKIMLTCGTDDHLYGQYKKFAAHLGTLPFEVITHEFPGGHEWPLWDKSIDIFLSELVK